MWRVCFSPTYVDVDVFHVGVFYGGIVAFDPDVLDELSWQEKVSVGIRGHGKCLRLDCKRTSQTALADSARAKDHDRILSGDGRVRLFRTHRRRRMLSMFTNRSPRESCGMILHVYRDLCP